MRFRLRGPDCAHVSLELAGQQNPIPMQAGADGWHEVHVAGVMPGARYRFVLPSGMRVPDPASRYQPEDVHGWSEVVDPGAWRWRDRGWTGRPWKEAVVYEMHVGAFSPEGTFAGAALKLDHLAQLGVTAIQLMPVGDFPGERNWGYDGVQLYAPDACYGRPEDLKEFIDAAHERGMMVFFDVVYNHFGPEGNYLWLYAKDFFTDRHRTPWGPAVNFASPAVREFVVQNALYWLREYHADGLRLDAVHALHDDGPVHILAELAERVRAAFPERQIHLVLENEENESRWLADGLYTAQWNDDVHHVLHTAVSGERSGYYEEYCGDTAKLGRALAEGFVFQGQVMHYRSRRRGEPSRQLAPTKFVAFLQNHDQIGNRALGDRLAAGWPAKRVRAAAAAYLLAPQIPMLFMGEEWGAQSPFPFFCHFEPQLGEAVREGRLREFARFPEVREAYENNRIPDPQALSTFESAKLRWADLEDPNHAATFDWYRRILECRREWVLPVMDEIRQGGEYAVVAHGAVVVQWRIGDARELMLAVNLSDHAVEGVRAPEGGRLIWMEGAGVMAPWSAAWWIA